MTGSTLCALRFLLVCGLCVSALACSDEVNNGPNNGQADASPDADVSVDSDTSPDTASDLAGDIPVMPDASVDAPQDVPPDEVDDDGVDPWDFGTPDEDSDMFSIAGIVPPSGPLEGGTSVRISGQNFTSDMTVFLGSRPMAVTLANGELVGRTPVGTTTGPVTLIVRRGDEQIALADAFTYVEGVRLDSVSPRRLPTTGGVAVDVMGRGFTPETTVSFSGSSAQRVDVVSATLLRAISPARPAGGADVRVTTRAQSAVLDDAVVYFDPLSLLEVSPASGPTAGGQDVTLRGVGFEQGMTVRFGSAQAQVQQVDVAAGTASVRTPGGRAGVVDVTVSTSTQAARKARAYAYTDGQGLDAASFSPNLGTQDGGTLVTFIGQGLDAATLRVTFDGQDATVLTREATSLTVRSPAHAPGVVDVAVLDGATPVETFTQAFTYLPALELATASPVSGPVAGGTAVVLTGRGFLDVERVLVGQLNASFVVDSDTQITVTTPAHSAGVVDIDVVRSTLKATLSDAFTYTSPLEVWGFAPTRGAIAGGTYVSIRGTGFDGLLEVTFNGQPSPTVRRVDGNNLYVYSPPGVVGDAVVAVKAGAQTAQGPYPYNYFDPVARFGGASGGDINGAVNVSVYARGGQALPGAFVMLSTRPDTQYQGVTNASGQVTLSGPNVLGAQSVTATAVGYSTATVQAVDAENLTVFLNELNPRPSNGGGNGGGPPAFATIKGRVSAQAKLSDPSDSKTYDMAVLATTSPSPFGGNPRPGPGATVIGYGDYEIISRIGDLAVIALCGVFNDDTQTFDPQYMGVRRFVFMSDQETKTGVDVECNIPLDETLDVKLINDVYRPTGPTNNVVDSVLNFGFEGYFQPPNDTRGLSDILTVERLPAFTGALSDLSLILTGGSYTGNFSPLTQTSVSDITDLSVQVTLPPLLDVPEPVSPLPGGEVVNREIRWQASGPYFPSFYHVVLRNDMGIAVWSMVAPGTTDSIRIPEFPDFSALPLDQRPAPYVQGDLSLTITAVRIPEFEFDAFTYEDLGAARWEAYSLNRWGLTLPAQ